MLAAALAGCGSDAAPRRAGRSAGKDPAPSLAEAQEAGRYVVLWFHNGDGSQQSKATRLGEDAGENWGDRARVIPVDVGQRPGKSLAKRYGIRRTPQILVVAPNGAITARYTRVPETEQLAQAFVGPGMAAILLAVQSDQTVFLCIGKAANPVAQRTLASAREAESLLEGIAKVVAVDPGDGAQADLLAACKLPPEQSAPATLVISPRGSLVTRLEGSVTKEDLFDSFAKILQIPRGCGSAGVTGGSTCQPGRGVSGDAGCS
jgi:hypothetical protein